MRKLNTYLILVILLFGSSISWAQLDTTWIKTYGGDRNDEAFDLISTSDGGFLTIGSTSSFGFDNSQMYFLKLDSVGNIMWSKSHGGTGQESGHSLIQTSDGGYLGVGFTNSWGSGGFDLYLVKLDVNGNLEFEDTYGGVDWDFAWDVLEQNPGEYIIAGETQSFGSGGRDGWLVKYDDATQSVVWDKTVGTVKNEYFKSITQDSLGNVVAAGGGFKPNRMDEDVMATKFNSLGDTLWTRFFGDTLLEYANDVIRMSDSSFAFTGLQYYDSTKTGIYLLKIDQAGNQIWDYQWFLRDLNEGYRLIEGDSQRLITVGTGRNIYQLENLFVSRSTPNDKFWQRNFKFGDDGAEYGRGLVYLKNGYTVSAGSTTSYRNYSDVLLIKTDSNLSLNGITKVELYPDNVNVVSTANISTAPIQYIIENGILNFQIETNNKYQLSTYSLTGSLLFSKEFTHEVSISLNQLPKGICIIRILDSNGISYYSTKILNPSNN